MKTKLMALLAAAFLLFAFTGCATIHRIDIDRGSVIPVSKILSDPAGSESIGKAVQEGKDVVLFVAKGQSIPLKINLDTPLVKVENGKNSLVFMQHTYLLISRSGFMVSPDGERWAAIQDLKALKKLYGFKGGSLSIGFGVSKEEGASATLNVGTK